MTVPLEILIVDDQAEPRSDLVTLLRRSFPGLIVAERSSVTSISPYLNSISERSARCSAIVLEFECLMGKDPLEGPDTALWGELVASRTWTLCESPIWLILAANPDHPCVGSFRRRAVQAATGEVDVPRLVFLRKFSVAWDLVLIHQLEKIIHPQRIAARLQELLPSIQASRPSQSDGRLPAASLPMLAQARPLQVVREIHELVRDIEAHWRYLKQDLRSEIERYFAVRNRPPNVELSLR